MLERTALLRHLLAPGARLLARGTGAWVLRSATQARHFTWCLGQQLLVLLGLHCASPGAGAWWAKRAQVLPHNIPVPVPAGNCTWEQTVFCEKWKLISPRKIVVHCTGHDGHVESVVLFHWKTALA